MDTLLVETLTPALTVSLERSKKLLDAVTSQFTIDWSTGRASIQSNDAIVKAFIDIKGPGAEQDAQNFLALLNDGFAIPKTGVNIEDPSFFTIPWRALSHAPTFDTLTIENWKWLGIEPWSDTQEIRRKLAEKFVAAPDYMFEASHLSTLRESAASIEYVDNLNQFLPVFRANPRLPADDGGSGGVPNPPSIDWLGLAKAVIKFFEDAGPCLLHGQWSLEYATFRGRPIYAIGVRICLDRACADKVENALWSLLGVAGGDIATVITTLISKGLLTLANMLSWGTWVGLAIVHFALYWAILIETNKTANGVCIIHFWPLNSILSGGLVNGWAQGR
ncbi:MAG: hypothetical protein H6540_09810 [Bacteroidales bacterium]|nr:hypothetical protein [Bacteroidales bacterium]MCB9421056.1 hypothetical protein [Ardenticatenaceae bacterium]MCB9442633.1 hypothetical protein [Ardenticatenaceae bacterium]MCB9446524.1 hypothetical protein [Ardenticatenaceae bacterium]